MDTSYQPQSLFVTKKPYAGFEKIAIVTLSRDGDDWEEQISQSLHQEHPFIAEHNIQISLTKTDPESGVGTGSIQIDDKVLVPIIIEKFKLAPLDLFWHEDKLHPLTRNSLESVLQDTTLGQPTTPGQGENTDVSLYSRAQPPFDGKYSYAEFTRRDALVSAISDAFGGAGDLSNLHYELKKNATFRDAITPFLSAAADEERTEKVASANTQAKDRIVLRTHRQFEKIASSGPFEVVTDRGAIPALVFDHVLLANGSVRDSSGFMIGLDKHGSYAHLNPGQEVAGRSCDPSVSVPVCAPASGQRGVFFKMAAAGAVCTEPLDIQFATERGWSARSGLGQRVNITKMAGLKTPICDGRSLCLPDDWRWIKVARSVGPMTVKQAHLMEPHKLENFQIHCFDGRYTVRGLDGFPADGAGYEKTAAMLTDRFEDRDVNVVMKAAQESGSVYLCIKSEPGQVKTAATMPSVNPVNLIEESTYIGRSPVVHFPARSDYTIKLAAVTDDEAKKTVDSLLGLNFLNPENIYRFAEKVGVIESAKETTAKLLLASRLGLDVDSRPLRTAMFALDSIERDLRELSNAAEVEEQEG